MQQVGSEALPPDQYPPKGRERYSVVATGNIVTSNPTKGTGLHNKALQLWFKVDANGVTCGPKSISGTLPADGGNTRDAGTSLSADYDPIFEGKEMMLGLFTPSSNLKKWVTSGKPSNGVSRAVWQDLGGSCLAIPATGLEQVVLYSDYPKP